jgi:hypothetical protein
MDPASHWRALTAMDFDAAYRMLSEDHPGAAREVGDETFQRLLASAYAKAKRRAASVTSYDGYMATLAGLSVGLGDKHIRSRPLYSQETRDWAGLLIGRQGKDFVVVDEEEAVEGALLKGAKLVSCDNVPVERLADERLGEFKVVRGIEAQLIQRSYWLLLDDGNPFLKRPQTCRFQQNGQTRVVPLKWRPISREELGTRVAALPLRGAAGWGVRKVGDAWWISIQTLNEKAVPVVEEVRAKAVEMRKAPFIVLDLRGNGGGNSQFGNDIAAALLGRAFAQGPSSSVSGLVCNKAWRISDRNLKQLRFYRDEMGPKMGKEATQRFTEEYNKVAAEKAAGKSFSSSPRCPSASGSSIRKREAKSEYAGELILLTDNVCFSSCLLVTSKFRQLGALHVGEATDAATNYFEVRDDKLPSGLSTFSTMQAVSPASPSQIGPFVPARLFEGNIADTAALEKWIAELAG